jgi:predicted nucleic acid-binding protein
LTLYLDASALVKRYVDETGSDTVVAAMDDADAYSMCRFGFVETVRAVARAGTPEDVERMKRDWEAVDVVELDHAVAECAAALAIEHGLRSADALHLAAALTMESDEPIFATWDVRLHRAAREQGLQTLPAALS